MADLVPSLESTSSPGSSGAWLGTALAVGIAIAAYIAGWALFNAGAHGKPSSFKNNAINPADTLNAQMNRLQSQIATLNSRVTDLQAENQRLTGENHALAAENQTIKGLNNQLQAKIRELTDDNDDLADQNHELRAQVQRLNAVPTADNAVLGRFVEYYLHTMRPCLPNVQVSVEYRHSQRIARLGGCSRTNPGKADAEHIVNDLLQDLNINVRENDIQVEHGGCSGACGP